MINISKDKIHKLMLWFQEVLNLETLSNQRQLIRPVYRGEVYFCNLGEGIGTELCKNRPCIIVQNNILGRTSPNTIIVPITRGGKPHKHSVIIPPLAYTDETGTVQTLTGTVLVTDIKTLNKVRLGRKIGKIKSKTMIEIENNLIFNLGMQEKIVKYENIIKSKDRIIESREKKIVKNMEIIEKLEKKLKEIKPQK